jgi:hypothetical protein
MNLSERSTREVSQQSDRPKGVIVFSGKIPYSKLRQHILYNAYSNIGLQRNE